MLKKILPLLLLTTGSAYAGSCESINIADDNLTEARTLFQENCAHCHGYNANGHGVFTRIYRKLSLTMPTDFTEQDYSATELHKLRLVTREGNRDTYMPSFANRLTDQEINLLTEFLMETGKLGCMPQTTGTIRLTSTATE